MKIILLLSYITIFVNTASAQIAPETIQHNRKGSGYVFWGWNWDSYSNSDITFSGTDYHFTLDNVVARDKQSAFSLETYFGPTYLSIPQFNFRIGYCLSNHWDISIGMDHMKYVMVQDQYVKINGHIATDGSTFDGDYTDETIKVTEDFLKFEHTDGLNYENIEARYAGLLFDLDKISFNYTAGLGAGILIPKTNTTLLSMERHDDYHVSGYGVGAIVGLNVLFWDHFFIQAEMKTGIINMPDIRTTIDPSDRAHQQFMFYQRNIVFGALIHFNQKTKKAANKN